MMDEIGRQVKGIEDAMRRSGMAVSKWDDLLLRAILEDRIPSGGLGVLIEETLQKQMEREYEECI